jgi:hypothetical protein
LLRVMRMEAMRLGPFFLDGDVGRMELRKVMRVVAPFPMPPKRSMAAGRKPMPTEWQVAWCLMILAFSARWTSRRGLLMGGKGSLMLE